MANIWCLSAPLFSHTDWGGYLKTAQVLIARGHTVTWVSENGIAGTLGAAGVPFTPIRRMGWLWPPPPAPDLTTLTPQEAVMLRYRRALDTWMSEDWVGDATAAMIELADDIGKPDLILTDPFLTASALAAERLKVPLAVCGWIAQSEINEDSLFPVQRILGDESRARLERLCARFGIAGVNFSGGAAPSILSPHAHISYFNAAWYLADENNILPQTRFVGGLPDIPTDEPPQWLTNIPERIPLALITLGTTFTGDYGFFSWAAQAAASAGLLPIVVIGRAPIAAEEKAKLVAALPKGSRLLNWVSFSHVLPRCRLIFHHGGMGTTHAAVVYGIPQIAVPHAADQRGNARRVAQAKVGFSLSAHEVRHGALAQGAKALVRNETVIDAARQLAQDFAALGGAERAADVVEGILSSP